MNAEKARTAGKYVGAAATVAAIASLSAYVSSSYLLKMAINREEPLLLRSVERRISGSKGETDFTRTMREASRTLKAKENEVVEITARDGTVLVGHWMPVEDAKRIILAVHGWRGSWSQAFGMVADFWDEQGCSVLYVEQRATNKSGGDYIGFGIVERLDCFDWLNWLEERCGTTLPVYLCGVSMGATTVLMAAGLDLPPTIHGIIADCGFTSPHAIWKHVANHNLHIAFRMRGRFADEIFMRKLHMAPDISTTDALSQCTVPVLLIHGNDDHFVPVSMTHENYAACAGPKRLLTVPGADHGESYYTAPEAYQAELKRFWQDFD